MRRVFVAALVLAVGCGAAESMSTDGATAGTERQVIGGLRTVAPGISQVILTCPGGKSPVGGGYRSGDDALVIRESFPGDAIGDPTSWIFMIFNKNTIASPLSLYAICTLP